jgi:hypothetical protein
MKGVKKMLTKKKIDWIQFLSAMLVMVFMVVPLITGLPEKNWGDWNICQLLCLPLYSIWFWRWMEHHPEDFF